MIWVLERIIKVNELNDNDVFKGDNWYPHRHLKMKFTYTTEMGG